MGRTVKRARHRQHYVLLSLLPVSQLFTLVSLPASATTRAAPGESPIPQSGAKCSHLVTDVQFAALKKRRPVEPTLDRITLDRSNVLRWNGAPVSVGTLRQYLDISAALNPMPYVIFNADAGADATAASAIRRVINTSNLCGSAMPSPVGSNSKVLCQFYGYWAPLGTRDYTVQGIIIHANGVTPSIQLQSGGRAGPAFSSTYTRGRLHTSGPIGDMVYNAANSTISAAGGTYKRFVEYEGEGGCAVINSAGENIR